MDIRKLVPVINKLYDYGEISNDISLSYLVESNFIIEVENRYIITKKWIAFTGKVTREDLIDSLVCYYPLYLEYLLSKMYKEAYAIGQSGDSNALFEFVDSIPKFAAEILDLKDKQIVENEEIKLFYQLVFKGYPQYRAILTKLKFMQMAEDIEDVQNIRMGKWPDDIWVEGRKVSSNIDLKELDDSNKYVLASYQYQDYIVSEDMKEILSQPWKTFMIVLGMIISEYKVERVDGIGGISIRPVDIKNPYTPQEINIFIYDLKGKENKIGSLKEFVKAFCITNNFYLFPDKAPDIDKILFRLMESKQVIFKDGEYILNPSFDDKLYSQAGFIIKNRSRKIKLIIKNHIERFRREL